MTDQTVSLIEKLERAIIEENDGSFNPQKKIPLAQVIDIIRQHEAEQNTAQVIRTERESTREGHGRMVVGGSSPDTLIGYPQYTKRENKDGFWEVRRVLDESGKYNFLCECADEKIASRICNDWNAQVQQREISVVSESDRQVIHEHLQDAETIISNVRHILGCQKREIVAETSAPARPQTWTVYDLDDPKGYKTFYSEAAAKAHSDKITKIEGGSS
jgi:hypothetical protein